MTKTEMRLAERLGKRQPADVEIRFKKDGVLVTYIREGHKKPRRGFLYHNLGLAFKGIDRFADRPAFPERA